MLSKRDLVTLALVVVFGLVGAWRYTSGHEWLANLCVIPPSVYVIKDTLVMKGHG